MKLPILIGVVAFVLGLAGGTGFVMMRGAPARPAAAESSPSAADSTGAPGGAEEARPRTAAADSAGPGAAEQAAGAATPSRQGARAATGETPGSAPQATAPAIAAAPPDEPVGGDERYKQVARIMAGMKPVDAAKILGYLSDDQVEGILRASGVRQASTLMAQLPTERAAAMSRRMIDHPKGAAK